MELQSAAVEHHTAELRGLARELRWERRRRAATKHAARLRPLRAALGRWLVARGSALLDGTASPARAPR